VDISEPAIADAKRNAQRNGYNDDDDDDNRKLAANDSNDNVENDDDNDDDGTRKTRFVASRAELVMSQELSKLHKQKKKNAEKEEEKDEVRRERLVVAVVDPAREGLHGDVCRAIRMRDGLIQRLVYVSCNPTGSLVRDVQVLCGPPTKRYPGKAFRPKLAQPVDMFPLTDHCEMVMVFDRVTKHDIEGNQENDNAKKQGGGGAAAAAAKDVVKQEEQEVDVKQEDKDSKKQEEQEEGGGKDTAKHEEGQENVKEEEKEGGKVKQQAEEQEEGNDETSQNLDNTKEAK